MREGAGFYRDQQHVLHQSHAIQIIETHRIVRTVGPHVVRASDPPLEGKESAFAAGDNQIALYRLTLAAHPEFPEVTKGDPPVTPLLSRGVQIFRVGFLRPGHSPR